MIKPSAGKLIEILREISQRRAVDERMLSNTSMAAKCSQILTVICDEIQRSYTDCLAFDKEYKDTNNKPSEDFLDRYPNYHSKSNDDGRIVIFLLFVLRSVVISS